MQRPEPAYRNGILKNAAEVVVYGGVALIFCLFSGCQWLPRYQGRDTDRCRQQIEESFAAQQAGDLDQARKHLQNAADIHPGNSESWWNLAELSIQQDDYASAADELKHYITLQPNDPQGYLRLAQLYYLQNQYTQATEVLDETLRRSPRNFEAVLLSARLARKQSNHQQAIANYYHALQIDPKHVDTTLELAELLIARQESARASSLLRELARKNLQEADQARTHLNLGIAYGQEQRWDNAVTHLEIARTITPDPSSRDLYRLAYAHWKARGNQQALKLLIELADRGHWNNRAESLYSIITDSDAEQFEGGIAVAGLEQSPIHRPPLREIQPPIFLPDRLIGFDSGRQNDMAPPEWRGL